MAEPLADYLCIDDVVRSHKSSRRTVFRLIAERKVQRVRLPGDRRTYIRAADADALFNPLIVEARRHK